MARRRGTQPDPGRRWRRHPAGPQGVRVRGGGRRADGQRRRPRGVAGRAGHPRRVLGLRPATVDPHRRGSPGRVGGDHHRRPPAVPDAGGRRAAVPGHQRQRRRHQVQVRQPLRLPPLAHRRHQPGHRRDDRRQDRRGVRLRRCRQGLCRVAARPGSASDHHRGRSHLRPSGRHAGIRGQHLGAGAGPGRPLHLGHRLSRHHHRRAHGPDEAPGHRGQHRPLRQ